MKKWLLWAFLLCPIFTWAQEKLDKNAQKFAETISIEDLKKHVFTLASDEYEGRATGLKGQKMAAEYIAKHYEKFGLPAIGEDETYYQYIRLVKQAWDNPYMEVNGKKFAFSKDFYCFARTAGSSLMDQEVVFAGYGISEVSYNDYEGLNVADKVVMVLDGEPKNKKGKYHIKGNDEPSDWSTNWRTKPTAAMSRGANGILIVVDDIESRVKNYDHYINSSSMKVKGLDKGGRTNGRSMLNIAYISYDMANAILQQNKIRKYQKKINRKGKAVAMPLSSELDMHVNRKEADVIGENLLGFIEGSDKKEELIIITAHYDHLEPEDDLIYNGADDNASGTAALIEIAEAFAKAKEAGNGPRRSILVMPVSGEEKGLLGSSYYANVDPRFPLSQTIANLNVDMIGRIDDNHTDGNYLYIIGSDKLSQDLHDVNAAVGKLYLKDLELDYTFNDENDPNRFYYRSDHYNFVLKGVPAIFYFNGVHADYHKATDTVEKINFEALQKRSHMIFYTAWHLANRDERIKVDPEKLAK